MYTSNGQQRATTAETAKRIRNELKGHFPGVKFSVRTRGNAVDVDWTDGPTEKAVKRQIGRYEHGWFDGMTDSYNYTGDVIEDGVDWGIRWLFCNRTISDEAHTRFTELLQDYRGDWNDKSDYDRGRIIYNEIKEWDGAAGIPQTYEDLPSHIEWQGWHARYEAEQAEKESKPVTDDTYRPWEDEQGTAIAMRAIMEDLYPQLEDNEPDDEEFAEALTARDLFSASQRESWRVW